MVDMAAMKRKGMVSPRELDPAGGRVPSSRPPMRRMFRLHQLLQRERSPNCRSLASELEVSSKTVQRDIDFMRDQLSLPIEYDAVRFGFHYTRPVTEFPGVEMSEGEVVALLIAQKALEQHRGT